MPLIIVAGIFVLAVWSQLAHGLNPDVSWLLSVSERMLSGQRLYADIYEPNPPMSALIYLPVVWISRSFGVAPEGAVVLAVTASVLAAIAIARRILQDGGFYLTAQASVILLGALVLLPGSHFGEREHIAVVLLFPLLATAWRRSVSQRPKLWQAIVAGCASGLAMAIKPHFALPILLATSYGAWRSHSWRPTLNLENVIGGVVVLAYWWSVWVWFPEFFDQMLPLATSIYVADRAPIVPFLFGPQMYPIWLLAVALLIVYRQEASTGFNPQLIAAGIGFFLAYLIQGKGFGYHLLPSVTLLSYAFAQAFLARNGKPARFGLAEALALLVVVSPALPSLRGDQFRQEALAALAPLGPGLKIANFTSELELGSPLHRMVGGTLINSGPCIWIARGAIRLLAQDPDPARVRHLAGLETMERTILRQDLLASPPDVILAGVGGFDWLDWARLDPELSAILDGYELLTELGAPERSVLVLVKTI